MEAANILDQGNALHIKVQCNCLLVYSKLIMNVQPSSSHYVW